MRIGVWSYAIYSTHTLCLDVVGPLMPPGRVGDVLTLPAALLLDLPLCWLLHVYIERPFIELGRRLSRAQATSAPPEVLPDCLPFRAPQREKNSSPVTPP